VPLRQAGGRTAVLMEWLKYFVISNNSEGILINDQRCGTHYEKYSNNKLRYVFNYANGRLHGVCYKWWFDGRPADEGNYVDGQMHGIQIDLVSKRRYYFNKGECVRSERY
jgi:antitoxin component YwqK of YwqJK toxin-antitoxin module